MKRATYKFLNGSTEIIEYDESAPCVLCGEPVVEASTGGTALCPWCDMGKCRYCGLDLPIIGIRETVLNKIKKHMEWHRKFQPLA